MFQYAPGALESGDLTPAMDIFSGTEMVTNWKMFFIGWLCFEFVLKVYWDQIGNFIYRGSILLPYFV